MSKNLNSTKVVTGKVVLNHPHLFEPQYFNGSAPKYSTNVLIFKEDIETHAKIDAATEAAIEKGKFAQKEAFKRESLHLPLRDGDLEHPNDPLYEGCYFLNATSPIAPAVVDSSLKRNFGRNKVSAGTYAKVSIEFMPYSFKDKDGVSCRLHGVQTLGLKSRLLELQSNPEEDFVKEDGLPDWNN